MKGSIRAPLKRVAFISQGMGGITPPKAKGSIAIWTYETVRHLGRDQAVILFEFGEKWFRTTCLQHEGSTYVYLPTMLNRIINALHRRVSGLVRCVLSKKLWMLRPEFSSFFYNLGFILQAAWYARKWRCDVIHIQNFSQFVPVVRAMNPSAKIVLHMHCEWLSQLDPQMIEQRLKSADVVVGCSAYIVRKISERFPQFGEKYRVVYNGADVNHFLPNRDVGATDSSNTLRILFVGRISPEKGVHILIEAFRLVAEKFPTASLELVGGFGAMPANFLVFLSQDPTVKELKPFYSGDYMAYIKSRIPNDLAGRVTFHGNIAHRQLVEHYRRASLFVNSSLSDAFPIPVVEAMAAGLPIVASAVGGIPEAVVNESTGILVKPNDPEELARALGRLLGDDDLRKRMSARARDRAIKLFSWHAIAEQVVCVHGTKGENKRMQC